MPVDPFVEDQFFDKVKDLESVLQDSDMNMALIGVNPTYASTKYGYIIPDRDFIYHNSSHTHIKVKAFKEKPTEEHSEQLINQQAFWNCGVFAFKLGYMINQLEEKGLPTQYDEMIQQYERMPKISFDYEIVEKAEQIAVNSIQWLLEGPRHLEHVE